MHLTSQLSKAVERIILPLIEPYLHRTLAVGPMHYNRFACQKGKGARDALLLLVLSWVRALNMRKKVAVYCSDVSGAFDKASTSRLVEILRARGLQEQMVRLLGSWLRQRRAEVVVGGCKSAPISLSNMVYQGTVFGPILWNAFFGGAGEAVQCADFVEVTYADDLNAFREFDHLVANDVIEFHLRDCQRSLHDWGDANQVSFEASKESMHIIARSDSLGEDFRILGITFDVKLTMASAIHEVASEARWRLKAIWRSHRYHSVAALIGLFKSKVLSFLEYRTAGIYHATDGALRPLDQVQEAFLEKLGVSPKEALMNFNLAPLSTRRDIAMLGVIY